MFKAVFYTDLSFFAAISNPYAIYSISGDFSPSIN